MEKLKPIIIVIVFYYSNCNGQNGLFQLSPRSAGMGHTATTLADEWSLFNNPGGLSKVQTYAGIFGYENKYGIEGVSTMGAGFIIPISLGTAGISTSRFGDALYNEQVLSLTYANTFGLASLGLRGNYLQYNIEGFGHKSIFTIDFGGIAMITEQLHIGAYIRNINQAVVSKASGEYAPTLLNVGLSFHPSNKIILNLETEKDVDHKANFEAGLEYMFLKKLFARTGISTTPFNNYFGLGLHTAKLHIDYALTYDDLLGIRHQAGAVYILKMKE